MTHRLNFRPSGLAKIAIWLLFLTIPAVAAAANVYKCKGSDGSPVFSDRPCGSDAKAVAQFQAGPKPPPEEPIWCAKGKAPQAMVDDCLNAWRHVLRDPRSAYSEEGVIVIKKGTLNRVLFIDAYAKNGFGAFGLMTMECGVVGDLQIEMAATQTWIARYRIQSKAERDKPRKIEICDD